MLLLTMKTRRIPISMISTCKATHQRTKAQAHHRLHPSPANLQDGSPRRTGRDCAVASSASTHSLTNSHWRLAVPGTTSSPSGKTHIPSKGLSCLVGICTRDTSRTIALRSASGPVIQLLIVRYLTSSDYLIDNFNHLSGVKCYAVFKEKQPNWLEILKTHSELTNSKRTLTTIQTH